MDQRGFTLLELLVVLGIIGLILAFVPGFVLRGQPDFDVEVAARAVADGLRATRSAALLENREQLFALDVEERLFRTASMRAPVQIDRGIELTFQTARSELLSEGIGQIRFFPDGSSTGGRIGLTLDGRHTEISVDWLTGLVAVAHAAE
ncbi:MAG: General secretion pathway protein [Geminicoccaceae bacterium]|nr:General secretion pathway protein [Geminicoccaceae bacterium]